MQNLPAQPDLSIAVGPSGLPIVLPQPGKPQTKKPVLFPRPTDQQIRTGRVLIIDDEASVALTIRKHLANAGFANVEMTSDSTQAIATVLAHQPDLVLLDLKMPTSGLTILENIRQRPEIHHIPVIIFTSETSSETKLKVLNAAADDFLTKPIEPSELVARVRNTLSNKLMRDQITQYSMALESDVLTDELTQAANRRAFDYELNRRLIDWKRLRSPLSVLMIDIDYFKQVNDRHGHIIGDRVLQQVAEQIQTCVREMDLVARYGGEEFAVIMPSTNSKEAAFSAERIRKSISNLWIKVSDARIQVTVSVGIGNSMNGDDARMIVLRADEALYESKRTGRNRSCYNDGTKLNIVTDDVSKQSPGQPEFSSQLLSDDIDAQIKESCILAIDDEPSTTLMVKKLLKNNGFKDVSTLTDASQAVDLITEQQPDLVLMDIQMPGISGLEILSQLRKAEKTRHTPVVILTSSIDAEVKVQALALGANDVLHKPVHESELISRARNTLMAKAHIDAWANYSSRLEQDVRLRTAELMASRREAIQCLARAAESRDDATGQHILRVGRYAAIIAQEIGFDPEKVVWMEHAAQLHDVGKIGMPDNILKKPGKLTTDEFEYMKQHCDFGSNIIRDASHPDEHSDPNHAKNGARFLDDCNSPIMRMAAIVAESHHEKWDGTGYPKGKKGKEIPLEGRITAVADVFDALSTKRCYKDAFLIEECFRIVEQGSGTHFDPQIIDAFLRRRFEIIDVFQSYCDA